MTFWSRYIFGYWSFCILMLLLLWLLHFGHGTFFGHWSFCILMLLVLWLLHFDVMFKPNSRKEIYDIVIILVSFAYTIYFDCYLWTKSKERNIEWEFWLIGIYKVLLILWWKCLNQIGIFESIGKLSHLAIIGPNEHIYWLLDYT